MKKYKLNINSNRIGIVAAIVLFPLFLYLMQLLPKGTHGVVSFIVIAILLFGLVYIVTIISRGKIEIRLTEDSYKHIWKRRFLFSKASNLEIKWSDIQDYLFDEDRGWDTFQLTLPNKMRYKVYRYNHFPQKDDFDRFHTQFPKYIEKINDRKPIEIPKGKSLFQEKGFKWIMIVMTVVAILILGANIVNTEMHTNWGVMGMIVAGLVFYWMQILRKH